MPFGATAARRFPWTLQRFPSHRSANTPFWPRPTATHAVGVVHETALSSSSGGVGAGLAVGVVAQLVPFQDSANVVVVLWVVSVEPTASHPDAEAHPTLASVRDK